MRYRIIVTSAILACLIILGVIAWLYSKPALPSGLRWYGDARSIQLISLADEPNGGWSWAIATIAELQDGAHVVPIVTHKRPFPDVPGTRVVVANPIWRPPPHNTFVHLPENEGITAIHLLIRASRHTRVEGHTLTERDVWRVLTISHDEFSASDRIDVPALKMLPPLDSHPNGAHWQSLLQTASDWYREQDE